jgi:FixJ family two-component response regulator
MSAPSPVITIIDDDESVRRALRRSIRSLGISVETFATAEEFLKDLLVPDSGAGNAKRGATRCLILDVHLPGLSGLELQARLRAERRELPIVFITAFRDARAQEQALQTGAVAFLHKPFEEQALLEAVQKGFAQTSALKG